MGSGASGVASESPGGELRLPASGLRFSVNQLRVLNTYVDRLSEEDQNGRLSTEMESSIESLVQRLIDGAGQKDPRFRCCHLIALHRGKKMRSRSLEYLVTLDSLPPLNYSEECRLYDGPVGYGRIKLTGRDADKWDEFLTPSGYLCRDKVVERWVRLIARCANTRGSATRVLCAAGAQRALPYQYCYLEKASSSFMNTDRRLAIVEGAAWVMVRIGAGEAEAKLMLGVKVEGCSAAAYTSRVPLTHPLALLHYTSAQGGYYAVAVGPPSSTACPDRSYTWQLWHPGLEAELDAHCSELSTVVKVAAALNALIDRMREGVYQGTLQVTSRYLASCTLRRRLDRLAVYSSAAARCCVSSHASHHLLLVLDSILSITEHGGTAGYVYPVQRGSMVRRGGRDADWENDSLCIRGCLQHLHRIEGEEIPPTPSECLEMALFSKWEALNRESKASAGSTSKYSRRQLRYLWRVVSELVKCKNLFVYDSHSTFRVNLIQATSGNNESIEHLVHILAIMLDQARDLYFNNFHVRNAGEFDRQLSAYRSKKWNKLKDYYDASCACLIDAVRRDRDLVEQDLSDPHILMGNILNWLHKGAKDDKKYLCPVLKPYLEGLYNSSLENSWFLEEFDGKNCGKEFEGLREYCTGVHDGVLEPCMGLLDAAKKFSWAKTMVDFVDRYRHIEFRLVFPTGEGMAVTYPIKLPSRREHNSARTLTLSRLHKADAKLRLAQRAVLAAFQSVLTQNRSKQNVISRQESSEEILASVKSGSYWRNSTKPDIIPSTSYQDITKDALDQPKVRRRSRRNRPATCYGFPEISITDHGDTKTLRKKYHTLKSLVYTEPVENIKELRQRPKSAGSTLRNKEALSRPSILETLDFINSVKDALCVEESGASDVEEPAWSLVDEWLISQTSPLNLLSSRCALSTSHLALADLVPTLLQRGKFSILQELCSYLGEASEGALFALHRLARAARSRSSDRVTSSWKLPEQDNAVTSQKYIPRPLDYVSGDEAPPPPPPLPRRSSKGRQVSRSYADYNPPDRLQKLEQHLTYLESVTSNLNQPPNVPYTGIINPIYDLTKIPKDKFTVKRSKSLGRSFSSKNLDSEIVKYNLTLGQKNGKRTNDVVTAIEGMSAETGLDLKSSFFQRYTTTRVVGDSYRLSRIMID